MLGIDKRRGVFKAGNTVPRSLVGHSLELWWIQGYVGVLCKVLGVDGREEALYFWQHCDILNGGAFS